MRTRVRIAVLAGAICAAVPAPAGAAAGLTVRALPASEFSPKLAAVRPGAEVTFTNAGGLHNVKFDDGSFTQPPDASTDPWTVRRTMSAPGEFRYHCVIHGGPRGEGMSGTIFVNAAGVVPDRAPPRLSGARGTGGRAKVTIRVTSTEAGAVRATLQRRAPGRRAFAAYGNATFKARKGTTVTTLTRTSTGRRLAPGRYNATLVSTDAARNRSQAVRIAFTVT